MSKRVYFVITTYNQERYIKDAVRAAFAQQFEPLTIIISDDCSSDATFDLVKQEVAAYTGEHRVLCRQSSQNLGLARHANALNDFIGKDMGEADAALIIGAAGDDISLPERTAILYEKWKQLNFADVSLFSAMQTVAEDGITLVEFYGMDCSKDNLTAAAFASGTFSVYGCTQAFSKGLFDTFGPLFEKVVHEDAVIPFRAALRGGVHFIDRPLVCYRRVSGSAWKARSQRTSKDARLQFLRHASGNVAVAENQFADLQRYLQIDTNISHEKIGCRLQKKLDHYRYEARLAQASSHVERLIIMLGAVRAKVPVRKVFKWFSIFFMPSFYQYITMRQAKKKSDHV
ncbi:MAG: glycosyltransferase [Mariprofundaceae bacterium]|nr:glycosyltransferase [Mariprofundaceae bacterium]